MPNVLSPRDLVSRPDNMDETVLHMYQSSKTHFFLLLFNHTTLYLCHTFKIKKNILRLSKSSRKLAQKIYISNFYE